MKILKSVLVAGCAYSVAIIALFFAFAAISNFTDASIGVGRFFLILLFGQVISLAGYILKNTDWHLFIRYALHYLSLFAAFAVIFIVNGNITARGGSAIFSALVVFTFFYALGLLIAFAAKKSFTAVEKKIPQKQNKNVEAKSTTPKYTPRFK